MTCQSLERSQMVGSVFTDPNFLWHEHSFGMNIPMACCMAFCQIQANNLSNGIVFIYLFKQAKSKMMFITCHYSKVLDRTKNIPIGHLIISD